MRHQKMDPNKEKALQSAINQIEKEHGKGALMRLGAGSTYPEIESISTGSLTLDIALGIGGLPRGRVVEIYGPESSGKTTLAIHVIAESQKKGGTCAFIDAEPHQITAAKEIGCDVCEMHIGPYAEAIEQHDFVLSHSAVDEEFVRLQNAAKHILSLDMQCNAGHGLNYQNVGRVASIDGLSELHIGHSIVSRCIFIGMRSAVEEMKQQIQKATA